jgi:hypothetical protein
VAGASSASPLGQGVGSPGGNVVAVTPRIHTSVPDFVRQQLWPDEQVLAAFSASIFDHRRRHDFRHDKVVLTDQRIIAYRTALVHKSMNEMPYRLITGVHYNKGFMHGTVIVDAADWGMTLDRIGNDDAAFAEAIIAGSVAGRRFMAQ